MKLLFLLFNLSLFAKDYSSIIQKKTVTIQSFSTESVVLDHSRYIHRLSVEGRRLASLSYAHQGMLRIIINGIEVDVITFYPSTSRRWRKYVIPVNQTVRSIEFFNDLGQRVKVRNIMDLPFGGTYGGSLEYNGDIVGVISKVTSLIESYRNLLSLEERESLREIKNLAYEVQNNLQTLGVLKTQKKLIEFYRLLKSKEDLINVLTEKSVTEGLGRDLNLIVQILENLDLHEK